MDLRRIATATVAAASLALVAAGPAVAQPNTTPEKKGCSVVLGGPGAGQTIVYDDGYSFSVVDGATGKKHTFTCTDGRWVETVSIVAAPVTNVAIFHLTASTLKLVPLR